MKRLLIGAVVGWLTARWYYQSEPSTTRDMAGRQSRNLGERAHSVAEVTGEVARELAEEARAGAKIEGNNLGDKAHRIRHAATG